MVRMEQAVCSVQDPRVESEPGCDVLAYMVVSGSCNRQSALVAGMAELDGCTPAGATAVVNHVQTNECLSPDSLLICAVAYAVSTWSM